MNIDVEYIRNESVKRARSGVNKVKYLFKRIAKAWSMDVDALINSKDWPYLWRR
jgi:hypothetical protein